MRKAMWRQVWTSCTAFLIASTAFAQGTLTNVTVTPSNNSAGASTVYTIAFTPDATGSGLPADGRIRFVFPAGFDISGVEIAQNVSGLNSGYSAVIVTGDTLLLTRDGTGAALPAGTPGSLKLATINNSTAAASNYTVSVETQDNTGATIDGPTASTAFSITAGAANHIRILTGGSGNTAQFLITAFSPGGNETIHAASFDVHGNYIQDESVTWSVSGGIGTVNPTTNVSTLFTATTPGTGQITADHATLIDGVSGVITVSPGTLSTIKIVEGPFGDGPEFTTKSLSADETLTLHAAGYDGQGNYLGDQSVTWSSTGGLAPTIGITGVSVTFSPTTAPVTGTILATHATAGGDVTGTITVNQGAAHHVKVLSQAAGNTSEVGANMLTTGNNLTVHAGSFDADDNYINDVSVNWSLSGGIGTLFPSSGTSTIFTATKTGSGQITADHATLLDDATGTITVTAGTLASIKIVEGASGNTTEVTTAALKADETLTVHAAGFDANNNYIGDQTVTWARTGNLAPAINDVAPSITFNPTTAPANGTITATHNTAGSDATGTITVSIGAAHHIKVLTSTGGNTSEVTTAGLTTGNKLTVHAGSFDADDNYVNDITVSWGVSGGIGTLSATLAIATELTATTPGSGQIFADDAGPLLGDATGVITVNAGNVASIRIVEGISGNGPELATKNLNADDILFLHAAGYDAQGNYVGDQSVTWSSTGTLSPGVSGSNSFIAFNPKIAPASGTITATHATAGNDVTGTISVDPGAPHHVKVLNGTNGNTSEVETVGLVTGNTLPVHAAQFDADDNYIGDVSVSWNLTGGIGNLFPASGISTTFTATTAGTGQITADHTTLFDDATGTITVNAGTLSFIKIVEGTSGNGPELGVKTLTADQTLTVHAAGYDGNGNYVGDQNVTWGSTGSLAPPVNTPGPTFTFNPTTAPASGTLTADHATATDDASGTITVNVGAAHHVKILSDPSGNTSEVTTAGLTTGGTLTVHTASFDADDNYVQDVSVGWSVTGGIGTLSDATGISTTLTATTPGSGVITADHATLIDDATGSITVSAGTLDHILIVEGPAGNGPEFTTATLTADQTLTLHAAGYDAQNNYLGDQTVTWGSTGTLAPVPSVSGPSITFSPTTAPASGTITADHTTATDDATGTITVNVGVGHHVKVLSGASGNTSEVTTAGLTTGGTLDVHAASFDADDNYIADVSVNWSVSGGIGTLSDATGVSTTLTATTPGTGIITADHATLIDDATGTITVSSGTLAFVKIVEGPGGDGPELNTKNLTADDVLTVHAAGYDAQGNYLGDQTVTWGNTGTLAPALSGSSPSITFSPKTAPASGTITADHTTATDDVTGTISVSVGNEHHVKVLSDASGNTSEVITAGLTTGGTLNVHAASFDADDNYVQDVSVNWSVSGGIGTLNPTSGISTTLTATTPGSGQITADHATLIDDATGAITVSSGSLAFVKIVSGPSGNTPEVTTLSLTADDAVTIHAAGFDANSNYLGDQTVTWSSTGTLAPAVSGNSQSITFNPTIAPASGTIIADHASATDDTTGTINVSVGTAFRVKALSGVSGNTTEVTNENLATSATLIVHAAEFDADNNYIQDTSVNWSVSGGIGTLNPLNGISTTLTATTPGTGQITADHPTLIDDATGTITVTSSGLAFVRIVEGPAGDGLKLDTKNLTADQTLTVHAAGYDANGNYLGDQEVTWGSTGSLAPPLSATSTSITFSPTTAPATGAITADHPTATDDVTGTISVSVGNAQRIKVVSGASGNTTEVTTAGLTTGGTLTVHASSFDADDNYIADVPVDWAVTGGIGNLSDATGVTTTLTATTPGSGVISADHASLIDDATGAITVSAGSLVFIKIVEGPAGNTPEVASRSINADQSLTVHAAGFDGNGNYLGDQTVGWSSTGTLAPGISASATSITFSPTTAPVSGTIIADHATATDDTSGTISINVGAAQRVKVLSQASGKTNEVTTAGLTTGSTLIVHAGSFDADNNYITDVAVNWSVSGGIGAVNPTTNSSSTTFTATTPGTGVITADHATLIDDATGTITVSSGTLSYILIVEGPSGNTPEVDTESLTADQTLTVHAAGFDASDNYLGDQTVTWGSTGTLAPALSGTSSSITFNPTTAPASGTITASHPTATDDATGTVSVSVGIERNVFVLENASGDTPEVGNVALITGQTLTVHASSFDADKNYVQDVSVSWLLSGNIGLLNPQTGVTTTLTANTAGTGVITADHATIIDDATGTITVSAGQLSFVRIVEGPTGDGPELGDRSLTTDDILQVHAAGYDAQNNYVGDQPVNWSVSNSIGTLNPVFGTATSLRLTTPGTGKLFADHATAADDSSGVLTVSGGSLFRVKVLIGASGNTPEVTSHSMTTDDVFTVHAGGFDITNNYLGDFSVDWSVSGNIGALNPASGISTTLNANKVGNGQILADHATAIDGQSGIISVSAGALNYIQVVEGPSGNGPELGNRSLNADATLTLHAAGFDADSNYVGDRSATWSSTGTLAPAVTGTSTNITFSPTTAPATGTITATHAMAGSDETGTIAVGVGALHHATVLSGGSGNSAPVGATTLNPGQTLVVHAGGFDADNNYISDQSVNWSVIGPIGNITPASGISATFTAQTVGTGTIRADASGSIQDGVSGTITVALGNVARIRIRTAPNNGGSEFGNFNMTADDAVTLYAAGYDAGDNFFGDVSVNWSSTGNLSPQVSATGSSFTFSPIGADAGGGVNGTIVATHTTGGNDATGTITVFPGAPVGDITLTANPSGLPADGSSISLITSSLIQDAENNDVGANKLFTVTITPASLGTIVTTDADPATPGHQVATDAASELNFTFRAGSVGGVATITVTSGLAASGNTQISMGSLAILSVSTTPDFVSRGQSGAAVSMTIQNLAASPVTNLDGQLTFTGSADRTSEYTVTPNAGNPTNVSGNSTATLVFLVDVSANATLEAMTIDGSIAGDIGGSQVTAIGAATTDSWMVQRAATMNLQSVVTAPDTVSQGQQNIVVTVNASNNLGQSNVAGAVIDSVRLMLRQGPVNRNAEYVVAPNPANPTVIPGNSTASFSLTVNVGLTATPGLTNIDAEIYAHDANSNIAISDLSATTTDNWVVVEGNAFSIVSITPSQAQVTESMLKAWQIQMQVQNSGTSNISIDLDPTKTFLKLFIGSTDVTSEYTIGQPTAFDEGGTTLGAGATGTLSFPVTQTGSSTGIVTISGSAAGQDISTGLPISDNTNDGGTGDVLVQSRGVLGITGLQLSQTTVTQNRGFDWTVTATVTNTGQSAIRLQQNPSTITVGNNAGYVYIQPQFFTDGDSILDGNQTKQYLITVDQTGSQLGTLPVSLVLNSTEINSNRSLQSNTGGANVTSQSPANLQVRAVRPSRQTVTAGQTNPWTVTVVVENTGQSQVALKTDGTTNLRFRLNNIFQNDYNFNLQPATWLGNNSLNLAGNATDSLRFTINTTGSNSGFPELWVTVNSTESNSQTNITGADNGSTSFQVQTAPVVSYIQNSMLPDIVNNNGFYAFKVRVNNAGQATVALQSAITTFEFSDGTNNVVAALDANMVTSIPTGDTTLTFRQVQIPANLAQQNYTPTIKLRGTENGNAFSRDLPVTTNELQVTAPSDVQIISLQPSLSRVTRSMEKDWSITMAVRNNGGTAVRLDSVKIILFNGGDVTSEYTLTIPTQFSGSGGVLLAAGTTDSLRFEVLKTGIKQGPTTIQGRLWVTDQSNNQQKFIQTDTGGSFDVQGPASLAITQITASQPRVTQNMTVSWSIDMALRNAGGSDLDLILNPDSSNIQLSLDGGDYQISYPAVLVGGGKILAGNSEGILRFTVTRTGAQTGTSAITGTVRGIEINSDVRYSSTTDANSQGSVVVETAAQLRVTSTIFTGAPNLPRVNTSQPFTVVVEVENFGQEIADSVRVGLSTNGSSAITPTAILIEGSLNGGETKTISFGITASSSANPGELFTANLISAKARNTGQNAAFAPPIDNTETAIIQLPAALQIVEVATSVNEVTAEQNIPWQIFVLVRNNGTATIDLNTPDNNDIQFKIGANEQLDYSVQAPTALAGGGLALAGGITDTLKYTVVNTGRLGGNVDIFASASGADRNTTQALSDQGAGSIVVTTSAAVRVLRTDLIVNNTLGGTETGLVNTNQSFSVRAVAENRGLEELVDVRIELSTDGSSTIPTTEKIITSIQPGETGEITFDVTAAATPTAGATSENFTATILSATAAQSQEPATIFLPADANAQVQVQTPASLAISAITDDSDNVLSSNQLFEITATVANIGQAAIDSSGRAEVQLPSGFALVDPSPTAFEQSFAAGQPVKWKVRAPSSAVASADLTVRISQTPRDRNADTQANVQTALVTINLRVVEFDLSITNLFISEPPGAMDNILSTQQNFTVTANIAFSADLAGQQRSVTLEAPAGYQLLSPATIDDFTEISTWQVIAPNEPHGERSFIATAQGLTGLGSPKTSTDTLRVTLVNRALVEVTAFISEPLGAQDGTLSQGQSFTIRANLTNRGTAVAIDTGSVRLELGQTGVTTTDPLEQPITTAADGFVEWRAQAPNTLSEGEITVRLIRRLIDENTNLDAAIVRETSQFTIRTVDAGMLSVTNIEIREPVGATDGTVSTSQEFTVLADLAWQSARNVTARLLLPAGFSTENEFRTYTELNGPATSTWIVRAPVAAIASQQLRVQLEGTDANDDSVQVSTTSAPLQVDVVERANLRLSGFISAPERAAVDGIVSVNQLFEITGELVNLGQAQLVGIDSIRIVLPEGYSTQEPAVKSSSGSRVLWQVKARSTGSTGTESITLRLERRPLDENTNLQANVETGEVAIPIQTEPKRMRVTSVPVENPGPTSSGQPDIVLLSMRLLNLGNENSSDILLRGITFFVENFNGEEIAPNAALKRLRITGHQDLNTIYANISPTPGENPLTATFASFDTLAGTLPDTIDVVVDVADNPQTKNFQLAIRSGEAFDAIDADSRQQVEVEDELGNTGLDFTIFSTSSAVTAADFEEFYNYPNPFRPDEGTWFDFFLPQTSQVEFKILTLAGELVYEKTFDSSTPQAQAGARKPNSRIPWDGRNGNGDMVLNGVYIAVLKTSAGVVTTKVAVAK